jgi:hypothetical protein
VWLINEFGWSAPFQKTVFNKVVKEILQEVEKATSSHPNDLRIVDRKNRSWFNYHFHMEDDPNQEIKLVALLFHIPS